MIALQAGRKFLDGQLQPGHNIMHFLVTKPRTMQCNVLAHATHIRGDLYSDIAHAGLTVYIISTDTTRSLQLVRFMSQ